MTVQRPSQFLVDAGFITNDPGAKFARQMIDDSLFNEWKEGNSPVEEVLSQAHEPDYLARRILNAKRGIVETDNEQTTR